MKHLVGVLQLHFYRQRLARFDPAAAELDFAVLKSRARKTESDETRGRACDFAILNYCVAANARAEVAAIARFPGAYHVWYIRIG